MADVLALIQVLAYDKYTSRSESGLVDELKNKPDSEESWIDLGRTHPEFFRVRFESEDEEEDGKVNRVSLISRYALPNTSENGKKIRPILDSNAVNKLMDVAIEINDRQLSRSERWKILLPMVIAIVGAGASIVAAIIGAGT
ncbi:hypothetical protein A167_03679 [Alcanivorax sp. S71-1-4]|nr:hypothetical protein A167_03679 [Alcanivorax sp. S71-1-4]